jgi:CheY-like chemotaxis protein
MRVLVVDDEVYVRQFISTILHRYGCETLEAAGAAEALRIAGEQVCQLVITDCVMPGMTGPELVAQLKLQQYPARYLLISGCEMPEANHDLPFLAKPFTPAQLLEAVEKIAAVELEANSPPPTDLKRDVEEARATWRAAIQEQNEIMEEVPTEIPLPDGSLLISKAGSKRKNAYTKYRQSLRKYHDSLKQAPESSGSEPENSDPES